MLFSFDRVGFARHRRQFREEPERDLRDRRVLVTGGTDGIGAAAVEALSQRGARIELWGRDPRKGARLEAQTTGRFRAVDLGDLEAVQLAAASTDGPIDTVLLNAGAMPLSRQLTPQGHELVWGSQVLGHLLLCRALRRAGLLADGARVVWVASGGLYLARLSLHDLRREHSYQRHAVYANAKRAQVELCAHLANRWPELTLAAMHPGWVATAGVRHSVPAFHTLTRPLLRSPAQGADTMVWLTARDAPVPSGRFWFDRARVPAHIASWTHTPPAVHDALVAHAFAATEPFLGAPSRSTCAK